MYGGVRGGVQGGCIVGAWWGAWWVHGGCMVGAWWVHCRSWWVSVCQDLALMYQCKQ